MEGLKSAILYQNKEKTITLVDIPTSISLGQLLPNEPLKRVLLSSLPLEDPYHSTEPKSDAARAKVVLRMGLSDDSYDYADIIRKGLHDIREQHRGNWCLPRHLSPLIPARRSKKRKIGNMAPSEGNSSALTEPDLSALDVDSKQVGGPLLICTASDGGSTVLVQNATSKTTLLTTTPNLAAYSLPSRAAATLGTISHSTAATFRNGMAELYIQPSSTASRNQFDLILLDPPWSNRSVTRSKKYKTMAQDDPVAALSGILDTHAAPGGLVACWITNKAIVRSKAIVWFFDTWNVDLIEEWIWVKTTVKGEPVYDIDGLWRKPYEVLLLGRKYDPHSQKDTQADQKRTTSLQRRLIFGVPDLHSRKPCLRELIEPLMPDPANYRAIEVFARNMTAGWLAWGDEALKFNWNGHWSGLKEASEQQAAALPLLP